MFSLFGSGAQAPCVPAAQNRSNFPIFLRDFPPRFSPRFSPAIFPRVFPRDFSPRFFPAIFPRDFSPRFLPAILLSKKNALTVVRCNGADGYCDPPRRLDDELDPLRPPPPCRIRMSFYGHARWKPSCVPLQWTGCHVWHARADSEHVWLRVDCSPK